MREKGMSAGSNQDFLEDSTDEIFLKYEKLSSTLSSPSYEPSTILSERMRSYLKDELPQEIDRGVKELREKKSNPELQLAFFNVLA